MKDKTLAGGIVVMIVGAFLIGVVWFVFLQPARTPTAPLEAIPLEIEENSSSFALFEIMPAESEVTFTLNELLRGLPTTVVGRSGAVVGQIAINFENPAASQIGPVLINARTFFTDNEFRNKAIHSFILDTETHEFITFTPYQMSDLPNEFTPGETISFQVTGDLTIREITQPVTFLVTVVPDGRSQLNGSATANIARPDFNLQIPDAPGVANVDEEVTLAIDFTAYLLQETP